MFLYNLLNAIWSHINFHPKGGSIIAIYKLGEISKIISGAKTDGSHGDIPVVGSGGIFGHTSKSRYNGSSILLPRKGTMKILWFPNAVWNVDTAFLIGDIDIDIVIKKYLLYLLLANDKWKSFISGSTIPSTRITDWRNLSLNIPPFTEQQKIIDIIEPHEKLFLSYSNCVKIDNIDDATHDINQLINIIEPFESMIGDIEKYINTASNLIGDIINNKLIQNKTIKLQDIAEIKKYSKLIKSNLLESNSEYYYNTGKTLSTNKMTTNYNFEQGVSIAYEGAGVEHKGKLLPMLHKEKIYIGRKWGIISQSPATIYYSLSQQNSSIATSKGIKMPKLIRADLENLDVIKHEATDEIYLSNFHILINRLKNWKNQLEKMKKNILEHLVT